LMQMEGKSVPKSAVILIMKKPYPQMAQI
jgi:hypothetical protein